MRDQQLEAIRAACIKANPEIALACRCYGAGCQSEEDGELLPIPCNFPVRLADVLLAIGKAHKPEFGRSWDTRHYVCANPLGGLVDGNDVPRANWNLREDNLTEQGDECVAFLHGLLR